MSNSPAWKSPIIPAALSFIQGQIDFLQPFEDICLVYQETFPADPFDVDYSILNNVKDN